MKTGLKEMKTGLKELADCYRHGDNEVTEMIDLFEAKIKRLEEIIDGLGEFASMVPGGQHQPAFQTAVKAKRAADAVETLNNETEVR